MRFPDTVTIRRPTGTDAYGNAAPSFDAATESTSPGFLLSDGMLFLPADTDARDGDRFVVRGRTFEGDVSEVRSPARVVLKTVALRRIAS